MHKSRGQDYAGCSCPDDKEGAGHSLRRVGYERHKHPNSADDQDAEQPTHARAYEGPSIRSFACAFHHLCGVAGVEIPASEGLSLSTYRFLHDMDQIP